MAELSYDFVIFGSTPFASILAGILAQSTNKRVLRVGAKPSPQRLERRLDLALPVASRPQTWDVLLGGEDEIRSLLRQIGAPDALIPKDVQIVCDTDARIAFTGHLAHVAAAAGLKVARRGSGFVLGAVPVFRAERAREKIEDWLTATGVRSIEPHEVRLQVQDEHASLVGPSGQMSGDIIVLADDQAVLELPPAYRPTLLRSEELTSSLVSRTKLPAAVQLFPDRGIALLQQDDGSVMALIGGAAQIDARLGASLPGPFPITRLATGRSHRAVTADGAPLIGALTASGFMVAAGLGDAAVFFAPALARHLAGTASVPEARWFAAHAPSAPRDFVSEAIS